MSNARLNAMNCELDSAERWIWHARAFPAQAAGLSKIIEGRLRLAAQIFRMNDEDFVRRVPELVQSIGRD